MTLDDVFKIVGDVTKESSAFYSEYVLNELKVNCNENRWTEINGFGILSKHIVKNHLNNKIICEKKEVEEAFELILSSILEEVISKYIILKEVVITMLYSFKKINSAMNSVCLAKVYGDDTEATNPKFQELKRIIDNYEKLEGGYSSKFKNIEMLFSKQKFGIEILIEAFIDTPYRKDSEFTEDMEMMYQELIAFVHEIGILVTAKDFVTSNVFNCKLKFEENGMLHTEIEDEELASLNQITLNNIKWLEEKENDKFEIPSEYIERLNSIVKQRIGLSINELDLIHSNIASESDSWKITTLNDFKSYINSYVDITDEQFSKMVDLWVRFPMNYDSLRFNKTYRDSRVTRKPLLPLIEEYYLFSDNVLLEAIAILKNNIIYDTNFYEGQLGKRFDRLCNKIDTCFEVAVKEKIDEIDGVEVKHHIEKIKNTTIKLPNEIDLIIVTNNTVYVGECKNMILKSDYKAIRNELIKTKGEFTLKLDSKVNSIKENLKELLSNEFNIIDCDNYEVKGIFITNKFSFTSGYKGIEYKSINYCDVREFFEKEVLI